MITEGSKKKGRIFSDPASVCPNLSFRPSV
jgi:hypothetical protein